MSLVTMREILKDARMGKYAIGAFEFWSYDSARAVVSQAQALRVPVILQVGTWEIDYMDGYDNVRYFAEAVSERYNTSVALHLDHATTLTACAEALDAGFTSIMMDASAYDYKTNVRLTNEARKLAEKYDASVEAEIGTLGGSEGGLHHETDDQTKPEDARRFVEDTGIDCLAVAIGTAHGFYTKPPVINIERLKEIAAVVDIPLVMHGGSGTPEDKVAEAIENGIAKVNICTEFIAGYGKGYRAQDAEGFKYNVNSLFRAGSDAGAAVARHKMELFLSRRK
ncbi:MAG: class II fructose-bisphosphate aldolase [Eubacteriales bacterium]|nr:class II fructose-bisphosphate aldolase [Eubacteriales bacterium]